MKRLLFLLLAFATTTAMPQGNYFDYYRRINRAELYIIKDSLRAADTVYRNLTREYGSLFRNDLWNAALCSALLGDEENAKTYIKQAVRLNHYKLQDFLDDNTLKQYAQEIAPGSLLPNPPGKAPVDSSYIAVFDSLYKNEQAALRLNARGHRVIAHTTRELFNLFTSNPESVVQFFKGYDHVKRKTIIVHYYRISGDNPIPDEKLNVKPYNLDSIYLQAVKDGLMHVSDYTLAYGYRTNKDFIPNPTLTLWLLRDSAQAFLTVPSDSKIRIADSIRSRVGMPKFDDMLAKIRYLYPFLQNYPMAEFTQFIESMEKDTAYLRASDYNYYFFKEFQKFNKGVMSKLACRHSFRFAMLSIVNSCSNPNHPLMPNMDETILDLFRKTVIESKEFQIYKW